jgi:hypothetical protein
MPSTFFLSSQAANRALNQGESAIRTARRANTELAAAATQGNRLRAENLYGVVQNFCNQAERSNTTAKKEINDMARQATPGNQQEANLVRIESERSQQLDRDIAECRASANNSLDTLTRSIALGTTPADAQATQVRTQTPAAVVSSAAVVVASQQADDQGARAQNPPTPPEFVPQELNPDAFVSGGLNPDALVPIQQDANGTQNGQLVVNAGVPVVTAQIAQSPGPSAPGDDVKVVLPQVSVTGSGISGDRPTIAPEFLAPIVATPNKLAKLSSMNYSISIYILNIEEYKRLVGSPQKTLPSQQLIIQSGGIDQGLGYSVGQRNKYFDVDFYLDNVVIDSSIGTQNGNRAHNALTLNFSVIEPNGITFIQRLRKAVKAHQAANTPTVSEANQNFLMIIRFYGYDSNGQIVNASQLGLTEAGSDTNAIIEKLIPFQIADIKYKLSAHTVEYNVMATVPQVGIGFSQITATIPFDFELQAPDVATLLNGRTSFAGVRTFGLQTDENQSAVETQRLLNGAGSVAPPNASVAASVKTYTNGLADALNQHQLDLKNTGQQEFADQFEFVLANVKGLSDAKMSRPGRQDKQRTATPPPVTANQALNPNVGSYNSNSKTWSVTRGTQIVQLIDLVMRNSTYITSQQNIIFDEVTNLPKPQTPVATVQWFRIGCQVTPLGYDNKRRCIAYKSTYYITPYQINDPRVPLFPNARFRGTHKVYNYWFTGENNEVLDLDIEVNYNYTTTFGNYQAGFGPAGDFTSSSRIYEKRYFQTKPNSEGTGGTGDTTTPAAQLAERLYNDADIQKAQLTIVGDPDWIQQSEVFYNDPRNISLSPFMPDGSMNTAASEVLYEIKFNPVNDYNLNDGLGTINSNGGLYGQSNADIRLEPQSTVFGALMCRSNFRQGRFTQRLTGTIKYFNASLANLTVANRQTLAANGVNSEGFAVGVPVLADDGSVSTLQKNEYGDLYDPGTLISPQFATGTVPVPSTTPATRSGPTVVSTGAAAGIPAGQTVPNDDEASAFTPFQGFA